MMKKAKCLSLVLALALVVSMLAACGGAPAPASVPVSSVAAESLPAGITVTDMLGREVTLDGPAEKVVALTASDCEIIYALGAGGAVVGRGEYCNYPEEVLEVPSVESGSETNIEQIIALAPDLVLMSSMAQSEEQVNQLAEAGIAVLVSEAKDIAGTYRSIELIGTVTGKDAAAAALVSQMKDGFAEIEAQVGTPEAEKSVYFEISPLEYGLWSAGSGTFYQEIADMLKVKNIFADIEGYAEVSEEQVIERNPDYIVTITMYFGEGPSPEDEIAGRAGWQDLTAVKDNNIFAADGDALSRPANRLVVGARDLYDFIYG